MAIFFDRQTIHWLCGLTDVYGDLCGKLEDGEPFAYSRFGDGEFRSICVGKGSRGHSYFPDLAQRLGEIIAANPPYMMGLGWGAVRYGPFEMSRGIDWVSALSLHTAAIEGRIGRFFDALDSRRVTLVGPRHLRGLAEQRSWQLQEIPSRDCWLRYDAMTESLRRIGGGKDTVFLFCASQASSVLIDDMHRANPAHTYIDVGSVLDPFAGVRSRSYQELIDLDAMAAAGYCVRPPRASRSTAAVGARPAAVGAKAVIAELKEALRAPGEDSLSRGILTVGPGADEDEDTKLRLADLLRSATGVKRFSGPDTFRFKDVGALYHEAVVAESPLCVVDALNYLRLYQVLGRQLRELDLTGEKWFDTCKPRRAATRLIEGVERVDGFVEDLDSSRIVLAKLSALRSRESAFRQLSGLSGLRSKSGIFRHEYGLATYFDSAVLEGAASTLAERRASLERPRRHGPNALREADFLFLMSCEETFLRIYLPYWLSIAEYLKPYGAAFHVLITAERDEARDMVADAEGLLDSLARVRRFDRECFADNVSFSSVSMPRWCEDRASFSACARFLYAREISEESGARVVVQDIDSCVSRDPLPWLRAIPRDKVVLDSYSPDFTIDPWRKFSAAFFALPSEEKAFEMMTVLEAYLLRGLAERSAWYLDQNALSYLHDIATREGTEPNELLFQLDDVHVGLAKTSGSIRPIHALPVHQLFEKRHGVSW